MYAAAGGASLAGRKARQHPRAPPSPPLHPAPTGVRAYSCQHWEARLQNPPRPLSGLPTVATRDDVSECAAGRAAWQEAAALSVGVGGATGGAARRCSVLGDHPGARRDKQGKWHRNNRVRDASCGSSSESDYEDEAGGPWGVARLLYAGLGTLALGLVIYFVGTGDKGFKTPALRMVGPSLILAGLACCLLRICFCVFAKPCCRRRTNYKENRRLDGAEGEEMPLARGPRTGPAQCSPARRLDTSSCDVSSLSSGEEDERMRRYRTASVATSAHSTAPTHQHQATVQQITVQQKPEKQERPAKSDRPAKPEQPERQERPECVIDSAMRSSSVRRPPPRNVSFAGPDGELVLSPAQLRS